MKYRLPVMAVSVTLLVILNVWHWWPTGSGRPESRNISGYAGSFRAEDFTVVIAPTPETPHTTQRDLFQPKIKASPSATVKSQQARPPVKSPEQLAEEAARAELVGIRVMGVLFRSGKGQAFVLLGTETSLVTTGEKVGDRFVVESIESDAIKITDPITKVSGRIPVSGK